MAVSGDNSRPVWFSADRGIPNRESNATFSHHLANMSAFFSENPSKGCFHTINQLLDSCITETLVTSSVAIAKHQFLLEAKT